MCDLRLLISDLAVRSCWFVFLFHFFVWICVFFMIWILTHCFDLVYRKSRFVWIWESFWLILRYNLFNLMLRFNFDRDFLATFFVRNWCFCDLWLPISDLEVHSHWCIFLCVSVHDLKIESLQLENYNVSGLNRVNLSLSF